MKIRPLVIGALLVAAYAGTAHAQTPLEVRDAQQRLQVLGFYRGPIDGVWGPETASAAARYQQSRGTAFGGVEPARVAVEPARLIVVAPPTQPVALADPTDVRTVQTRLQQLNYYRGPIDGVWGRGTQAGMENFQRSRGLQIGQVDTATLSALGLEPAVLPLRMAALTVREPLGPGVIRAIQQRLQQQGHYNGPINGVWGPATESSLAQFQRSREIDPSGRLTPMTAAALGLDPNNLSLSALPPR